MDKLGLSDSRKHDPLSGTTNENEYLPTQT